MGRPLLLYIFLFYWRFLNALFTVEAPQPLYTVEHGNNVTMECTFPVNGKLEFKDLSVSWEKKDELKQVYELYKGKEDFKNQNSDFKGRIKLLKENLNLGQSLLQITDVKLRDAGDYRCIVEYGGADYKTVHLEVKAPYRIITQGVVSTGHKEWKLTCQSEGYPEAEVIWQTRDYEDLTDKANTRYETGSDQLYRVTSTLTIKSEIDEIFYCIFWNKELQENTSTILHIADLADGVLQTQSRRFVGAALIATAFVGSGLLFAFCIKKARANKGNITPMASLSMYYSTHLRVFVATFMTESLALLRETQGNFGFCVVILMLFTISKVQRKASTTMIGGIEENEEKEPSKDKDTHDCRDTSFEDRELKYIQIEKT